MKSVQTFQTIIVYFSMTSMCFSSLKHTNDNSPRSKTHSTNHSQSKPTRSPKRGIAYNIPYTEDLAVLQTSVSWWYNWGGTPSSSIPANYYQTYGMDFVPMLWNQNFDAPTIKNFILAHSEVNYLLILNEPNLTDQANRTPAQAAADWPKYEQVISDLGNQGRIIYLVGPAMSWGTMTGYSNPVTWLDAFYAAYQAANGGRKPRIDYLAFHWYDYGLSSQLNSLQKYGKKIWLTEMANWNAQIDSYAKQEAQMQVMVDTCERRSDVFRYAWFIGRGSGTDNHYTRLFTDAPGVLSELGQYYINLPFDTAAYTSAAVDGSPTFVSTFTLGQNYPNPFNPTTNISYEMSTAGFVSLKVFDLLGREVATLVNEEKSAGKYYVEWNAEIFNSGVYFFRMQTGSFVATKKMILIR